MVAPSLSPGTCCIAGGGPAGMMLGYLLARAGIEALVLEKHADFLRDFRGDTVHPSTLEVMHELGVLEEFLKRPHHQSRRARARIGDEEIVLGDMSYLRTQCRFLALMPQWEFLDFLAEQGRRYATFRTDRRGGPDRWHSGEHPRRSGGSACGSGGGRRRPELRGPGLRRARG